MWLWAVTLSPCNITAASWSPLKCAHYLHTPHIQNLVRPFSYRATAAPFHQPPSTAAATNCNISYFQDTFLSRLFLKAGSTDMNKISQNTHEKKTEYERNREDLQAGRRKCLFTRHSRKHGACEFSLIIGTQVLLFEKKNTNCRANMSKNTCIRHTTQLRAGI